MISFKRTDINIIPDDEAWVSDKTHERLKESGFDCVTSRDTVVSLRTELEAKDATIARFREWIERRTTDPKERVRKSAEKLLAATPEANVAAIEARGAYKAIKKLQKAFHMHHIQCGPFTWPIVDAELARHAGATIVRAAADRHEKGAG
jgi:hypothetical protein